MDFTQAITTVSCDELWEVKKDTCSRKFINLIKSMHDGVQAYVVQCTYTSSKFALTNDIKQGCVLSPILFSLYLTAMLESAFERAREGICWHMS